MDKSFGFGKNSHPNGFSLNHLMFLSFDMFLHYYTSKLLFRHTDYSKFGLKGNIFMHKCKCDHLNVNNLIIAC